VPLNTNKPNQTIDDYEVEDVKTKGGPKRTSMEGDMKHLKIKAKMF